MLTFYINKRYFPLWKIGQKVSRKHLPLFCTPSGQLSTRGGQYHLGVVYFLNCRIAKFQHNNFSSCVHEEFTAAGCFQRSANKCSTTVGSDSTNFKFWDVYNGGSHVFSDVFQLPNTSRSAYETK